jgi:hypothetical protein
MAADRRFHCGSPSSQARVMAVGRPVATSRAKVGPDSTARRSPGAAARVTSAISRPVPASIPLAQSTRSRGTALAGRPESTVPTCCAGHTTNSTGMDASCARSLVTAMVGASVTPGR